MRLSPLLVSLVVAGAIATGFGCSSTSVSDTADASSPPGTFGCCPDVKPTCILLARNGPKESANDICTYGNDGAVFEPNQDGWTRTTDAYGCGIWVPPKNGKMMACGVPSPRDPEDAGPDASPDAGDASPDAGDASTD